jgi:hypothetical protein
MSSELGDFKTLIEMVRNLTNPVSISTKRLGAIGDQLEAKRVAMAIKTGDLHEQIEILKHSYDILFHAVCKQSCVYKESEAKELNCCEWSILLDDFDKVINGLNDIDFSLTMLVHQDDDL